jgi:hypothetical protein
MMIFILTIPLVMQVRFRSAQMASAEPMSRPPVDNGSQTLLPHRSKEIFAVSFETDKLTGWNG